MEDEKFIHKDYFLEEEKTPNQEMPPAKETAPPPASPPSSYYSQTFSAPEPKPKGNLIKIIIGVIVIGVLGTGTALATRIWDPLWNPFRPDPEKVINEMTKKMEGIKTFHSQMDFGINIKNESAADIAMKLEADSDRNDPNNLKSTGNMSMSFTMEGMQFSLGLETKIIGKDSYVKFTTIPALPMLTPYLQMMGIEPDQFKNQWIKVDQTALSKLLGGAYPEELDKIQEEQQKKQEEMLTKLKNLFENKKFYLIDKELPDEEVNGKGAYHYAVSLDKEEIKKIIPEIMNIIWAETEMPALSQIQLDELQKGIDNFFEKAGELSGELWIGKRDNLLYRFKGEKVFDLSKFEESAKGTISLKLDINLSKFNQLVNIEVPGQYKGLDEILGSLMGQYGKYLGEAQTSAKDARIIADMGQLRVMAELIYEQNNSYKNLCSNFTLNENAPDLAPLKNDIVETQGGLPDIICYSAAKSYCVEADLASTDRGRWCIDAGGVSKEISNIQTCVGRGTATDFYRCPAGQTSLESTPAEEIPSYFQASLLESILKIFRK